MGHHVKRIITHFAVKKDGKDKISALHLTIRQLEELTSHDNNFRPNVANGSDKMGVRRLTVKDIPISYMYICPVSCVPKFLWIVYF